MYVTNCPDLSICEPCPTPISDHRPAALQALSLAATGEPLIAPVSSGSLGVQTRQGFLALVQAGSELPQASRSAIALQAPEDSAVRPLELAVEVLADGNRMLGRSLWTLPPPVVAGELLEVDGSAGDDGDRLAIRLTEVAAGSPV